MVSRGARRGRRGFIGLILCVLCASARNSEVIDRIAVTVDTQVITQSRVEEEIRLAAFLNGEKPDLGGESRRRAATRLVERLLLEREMELTRYPAPPPEEAERLLEQLPQSRSPEAQLRQALAAAQITEETLRQYLLRQAAVLRFIEVRFRPEAQVSEAEIENCSQKRKPPTSAEEARVQCEEALLAAAADKAVDRWLRDARERSRIVYREEAFR